MSDPNSLEAFYEGLDARMAMPDEDWHSYASRRGKGVEQSAAASFSPTSRRNQVDGDVPMAPRNLTPPLPTPAEETLPPSRKRKASYEEPEPRARLPLSTKRGKHGSSNSNTSKQPSGERVEATKRIETLPPKNTIPEQSVRAPALNANMTSVIEDFTEVVDSPLVKSKTRAAPFVEESSNITTPGKAPAQTSRARSRTAVKQPTIILNSSKFAAAKKGKGKDKPEPVTPEEYARRLMDPPAEIPPEEPQALNSRGRKTREPSIRLPAKEVRLPQYLQDYVIFYAGGDLMYASISTRRKMDIIAKHGGRLLPKFDPTVATHIVTDTSETLTLSALGLKNLSEIPEHIPIVKWTWVNSNQPIKGEKDKQKMEQEFLHSAFRSRVPLTNHGKGKQKADASIKQMPLTSAPAQEDHADSIESLSSRSSSQAADDAEPDAPLGDVFAKPIAETSKRRANKANVKDWTIPCQLTNEASRPLEPGLRKKLTGFACDNPAKKVAENTEPCVNQDIVDKLRELADLHRVKPTKDDQWRVYSYNRAISALRRCKKRIGTIEQAMSLDGIGEKTAQKIMEIIETGSLRRIDAERTEDVAVVQLFQGIYGVGQSTAYAWYNAGCRTLDDIKKRKGGIDVTSVQLIGLKHYDDINTRMPREEAREIFEAIKAIALSMDSKLFVEIMGSYRRGKETCGDIDIMITRSPDDGRTHAGILPRLLSALRSAGVVTEDLSLSSDAGDYLEGVYRGLCVRPARDSSSSKERRLRRRLDILTIPWESRGAALIYYTGDDMFNRSMRQKANKMGYSLNQRGLFAGVVRSAEDRTVKTNPGQIIASETEEEIFHELEIPWTEARGRCLRG